MVWMARASFSVNYATYFDFDFMTSPEIDGLHQTEVLRSLGMRANFGVLPPEAFVRRAISKVPKKKFPDTINLLNFYGFSERLKNIIEEFEPGMHQFSDPVDVRYKDGRASEMVYSAFNPLIRIENTLVIEQCTAHKYYDQEKKRTELEMDNRDSVLVVDEALISGRHFWVAPDYYYAWFISDALKKRLDKEKIKKFDCVKVIAGRR